MEIDKPIIQLKHLSKTFANTKVLDGVNLKIPGESIFCILGKSGMGKSVLIKCINNIIEPDSGEIWYKNTNLLNSNNSILKNMRKDFGYLFQDSALLDSLTVKENIAFPIRETLGIHDKNYINRRVKELLDWVSLPGTENKMPSELSGGMRKRTSFARTLALNPKVLFCDEPTTGLDPITSKTITNLIVKANKEFNITCIVITHDIPESIRISDYLAFLNDGKIRVFGTPDTFMHSKYDILQEFILHSFVPKSRYMEDSR